MNLMNARLKPLRASLLMVLLFSLTNPEPACPAPGSGKDLTITRDGKPFVGGRSPKILSLTPVKEFKSNNGYYYYSFKALVRRSSGDTNGSMVLFKARTYGDAVAKLFGVRPSSKRVFDLFFPVSLDKTRFPPVFMVYKYKIRIRELGGSRAGFSTGPKEARGGSRYAEYLSLGLLPGNYEVQVQVEVELGPHPVRTLYDVIEWCSVILDLEGAIADKITDYSEWFTATGLAKKALKHFIVKALTTTRTTYKLRVKSKVPALRGMVPSAAVRELRGRLLTYVGRNTLECPKSLSNRVIQQKPAPGARVKKGTRVDFMICRYNPNPQPTPAPSSKLYVFKITNCGNGLIIGTEPEVKSRVKGSIEGCGMDWSTRITYSKYLGPFSTSAQAGAALCGRISSWWYNQVVPWGPYVKLTDGTVCPAFEPSVEGYVTSCRK